MTDHNVQEDVSQFYDIGRLKTKEAFDTTRSGPVVLSGHEESRLTHRINSHRWSWACWANAIDLFGQMGLSNQTYR